ncbi:interleukin-8-like isoform X1 [Parus major]|uniref:interleukin-8-like isoform X1 n=1 Tax=Parus major TaxID=9157 RepID=UPI0008F4B327|nr:interleukin-8-like isoform X1 [Parus major]
MGTLCALTSAPKDSPNAVSKKPHVVFPGKIVKCFIFFCFPAEAVPRSAIELRCQCISTHSKFIHPKFIQNVNLTPSGPHCKNVEVIATLRDGREVCLEPTAPWVKLIIKTILDKANSKSETVS